MLTFYSLLALPKFQISGDRHGDYHFISAPNTVLLHGCFTNAIYDNCQKKQDSKILEDLRKKSRSNSGSIHMTVEIVWDRSCQPVCQYVNAKMSMFSILTMTMQTCWLVDC